MEELFLEAGTSIQNQIFQNSYFFNKANSSKDAPFKSSYFFRKTTFWKQLVFQESNIQQLTFSEEVLLYSHTSYLKTNTLDFGY